MAQKLTFEELEKRFWLVANFTHSWEYWIGPDSKLSSVSPSCKKHTGYTQRKFFDNENLFSEIIHPDDKDLIAHHINYETDAPIVEALERTYPIPVNR